MAQNYDHDIDGCVNFEDFLIGIRGKLSDERQDVVDRAFEKFDKERSGFADIRDLR